MFIAHQNGALEVGTSSLKHRRIIGLRPEHTQHFTAQDRRQYDMVQIGSRPALARIRYVTQQSITERERQRKSPQRIKGLSEIECEVLSEPDRETRNSQSMTCCFHTLDKAAKKVPTHGFEGPTLADILNGTDLSHSPSHSDDIVIPPG